MSLELPTVSDIMRKEVYSVYEDEPVSRVIGIFREYAVPLVVVLDRRGEVVGAITERMALRCVFNPDATKARTLSVKIPRVSPGDPIPKAAKLMLENRVKALPVEESDSIIGTISWEDIAKSLANSFYRRLPVKDFMSRRLITATPDTTIGRAIALMRENGISKLPILDGGRLVGVLTIHDIIVKVIQPKERATRGEYVGEKLKTLSHQVSEIMTPTVITIRPDEALSRAISLMLEYDISCLVVVHDSKPVGILTRSDILEPLAALAEGRKPEITIQVCFRLKGSSEDYDRSEVIEVAERFLEKFKGRLRAGYLTIFLKEHRETRGGRNLIHCRARLNTDKWHLVGIGESWTPALAAKAALDVIERKLVVEKELMQEHPYAEEILTRIATEI